MLSYASTSSAPHSSSPLNPHRSSSPPLSSPTPGVRALPLSFTPRTGAGVAGGGSVVWRNTPRSGNAGAGAGAGAASGGGSEYTSGSSGASTPLSARYVRGSGARRTPRPTAPVGAPGAPSSAGDLFSEASTPTQAAMLREKFARRMARHERARTARHADLAQRRGTAAFDDGEDEDARVAQAQADDEELFRTLMVLQRRRDRHAAERAHELETGGSDPALPDFWDDDGGGNGDDDEDRWAAEAEEAAMAERIEAEMAAATNASANDAFASSDVPGDDEDWAAIAAMLDAQDRAGHPYQPTAPDTSADADAMDWE